VSPRKPPEAAGARPAAVPLAERLRPPTLDEVLDRAGGRSGGRVPLERATADVRADRDAR